MVAATELRVGLRAEFERDITDGDVAAFADVSGDRNPLHLNEGYSRHTNYGERIVHGAFQVALASAMAGMYLPGRDVVVGSFQCRFPATLRYPSRVRVQGEITGWVPQTGSGILRVRIVEISGLNVTAEIHVGFSFHEDRSTRVEQATERFAAAGDRPVVIVTGGSGGIGGPLMIRLAERYQVIGVARSRHSQEATGPHIEWVTADLTEPEWEGHLEHQLGGRKAYGFIHAAWPFAPHGSLLEAEPGAVAAQALFGSQVTIRVARFLRSNAAGSARLVILGTTAATIKPLLSMSAYSLGKATLEHTVRLIAPELALSNITVNLIAPSFVPVGMNNAKTSKVLLIETAKVPLGRLCTPSDVAAAVEFLLSDGASFMSGQTLPLTGAQL